MKNLFTLLLITLTSTYIFAQAEFSSGHQREFGINATNFINTFLSFNDNSTLTNNYLLTYKKISEDGKVMRMGGNVRVNSFIDNPDDNNSNFDKRTNSFFDIDYRIGTEKQFPLSDRWSYNIGFDGIFGLRWDATDTDGDKITLLNPLVGAGPIVGIQFMINERIGLLTEGSLYLTLSHRIIKQKSDDSSFDDSTDKETFINVGPTLPTNVIFFFRF